ncbi:hypothetical protein M758_UG029300 [Ceratodon purpureus]|nr:hypothetical protein M758_UG029300 [Ceratodon purpureus]
MRRRLEKSRCEYRKHFEETGVRHPECPEKRHPALLAWWASPGGSSNSKRMKVMNDKMVARRLAMKNDVEQSERADLPMLLDNTESISIPPDLNGEHGIFDRTHQQGRLRNQENPDGRHKDFVVVSPGDETVEQMHEVGHNVRDPVEDGGMSSRSNAGAAVGVGVKSDVSGGDVSDILEKLRERKDFQDVVGRLYSMLNMEENYLQKSSTFEKLSDDCPSSNDNKHKSTVDTKANESSVIQDGGTLEMESVIELSARDMESYYSTQEGNSQPVAKNPSVAADIVQSESQAVTTATCGQRLLRRHSLSILDKGT